MIDKPTEAESTQAGVSAAASAPGADDGDALGRVLGRGRDGRQAHNQHERDDESEKLLHNRFLLKKYESALNREIASTFLDRFVAYSIDLRMKGCKWLF